MVTFEQVGLRYGRQIALRNVSFELRENTICGLLGRNGAGKTSLLSLLASYRRPTSGSVRLWGENPYENQRVMRDVCLVYDRNRPDDAFKAKDFLSMAARFRPNWDAETAARLIRRFDIPTNKAMPKLSHGMRSAVYAVIGIAARAPLTVYDEAYAGMDAALRRLFIQEILEDYVRAPRTVIFSTHYIGEAERIFENVLVLDKGAVMAYESCDALRQKGLAVSGDAAAADRFAAASAKRILSERTLGGHKEIVLFGTPTEREREEAARMGLSLSRPALQDLFIHMTEGDSIDERDESDENDA